MMTQNKTNIFFFNCRGAANVAFYCFCKQYIDLHEADTPVIVETRVVAAKLQRTFNLLGFDGFEFVDLI